MVSRWWQTFRRGYRSRPSRILRRILLILAIALSVVILTVGTVVLLPAGRVFLLDRGVKIASEKLPGKITAGDLTWPSLGHLVLQDVRWSPDEPGDEPAVDLELLDVHVQIRPLVAKDVRVTELELRLRSLSLPVLDQLLTQMTAGAPRDSAAVQDSSSVLPSFPRPGGVPPIPSIAVEKWSVTAGRIAVDSVTTIHDLEVDGRLEAGFGADPVAELGHVAGRLAVVSPDSGVAPVAVILDHAEILVRPVDEEFAPEVGRLGTWEVAKLLAEARVPDPMLLPGSGEPLHPIRLSGRGRFGDSDQKQHLEADLEFRIPGPGDLAVNLPAGVDPERLGPLEGSLSATVDRTGSRVVGLVDLDLDGASWLDRGKAILRADLDLDELESDGMAAVNARVDSLDLALFNFELHGSGGLGRLGPGSANRLPGEMDLDLWLNVGGPEFPAMVTPWITENDSLVAKVRLQADGTLEEPEILLQVGGGARTDAFLVPQIDLVLESIRDRSRLEFSAFGGLGTDRAVVDSVRAVLAIRHPGLDPEQFDADLELDVSLPDLHDLEGMIPAGVDTSVFGPAAGHVVASVVRRGPLFQGEVDLDLAETSWVERGRLNAGAEVDLDRWAVDGLKALTAELRDLDLMLFGTAIQGSGELGAMPQGEADLATKPVTVDLSVQVAGPALLSMLIEGIAADDELAFDLELEASGTLSDPEFGAALDGGIRSTLVTVPKVSLQVDGSKERIAAELEADGGLGTDTAWLDFVRADLDVRNLGPERYEADFDLSVGRAEVLASLSGQARSDSVRVVRLDSMTVRRLDKVMKLQEPVRLQHGPGRTDFDLTRFEFTGDAGTVLAQGRWRGSSLELESSIDLLLTESALQDLAPSEMWSMDGGMDLKINGNSGLKGDPSRPRLDGDLAVQLRPHRSDPTFGARMNFSLAPEDTAGFVLGFEVTSADTSFIEGSFHWPGSMNLATGSWHPDSTRGSWLELPDQSLDLKLVNRRLPTETSLSGDLRLGALIALTGLPGFNTDQDSGELNGTVDGYIKSRDLNVHLPAGSRINPTIDLKMTGPVLDPVLGGEVIINSAFIRIPELPRNLHPVEGKSILWDLAMADSAGVLPDSLVVFRIPESSGPGIETLGPPFFPGLDVRVKIPRNLRVMGYGLEIQLEGEVHVTRGFDPDSIPMPAINGMIGTVDGTLQFMNRVFTVRKGDIRFVGDVPANPHLDMLLETLISGTTVRILVSGRGNNPVVELTSEPDMDEVDIMGVLLFGRPLNDLDSDQRGSMNEEENPTQQLKENLAGLAMVFGTAGIRNSMSQSLGVDMVELGSDTSGGSTLMVGKYLSPKFMLKYHQSLEKSGTYFMTLEYALNQAFKLVSTYGQGEETSGLEVQWNQKY